MIQDAVDDYLDTQNGLIKRDKDAKLYVYVFPEFFSRWGKHDIMTNP